MIPFELREFINVMSLIIFGGVVVSCIFAVFAYFLAIDRRKCQKRVESGQAD